MRLGRPRAGDKEILILFHGGRAKGQESTLFWISSIAAVVVAAAGLILRRSAIVQGLSIRRGIAGWALILIAILLAVAAGYYFWRMAASGGE